MKKEEIDKFGELLNKYDRFLLCLHENADADSLCINIAMAELLTACEKTVTIVAGKNQSFSKELHNLADWLRIVFPSKVEELDLSNYDCFIMLDASNEERLHDMGDKMTLPKIVVDHHVGNNITGAELSIVDPSLSSASQMVYEIAYPILHAMTKDFLLAVYMGIYGDTGGFKHGMSARTHQICGQIYRAGADPSGLVDAYNKSVGVDDVAMLAIATSNLKRFNANGVRFCVTTISQSDIEKHPEILPESNSNFVVRTLDQMHNVDVLVVANQQEGDSWRVRFRSFINGGSHACDMAKALGGGGHAQAASCTIYNNDPRGIVASVKREAFEIYGS
jgi:bifunctional oligoribonuclease and PAP phosphatase NrnA